MHGVRRFSAISQRLVHALISISVYGVLLTVGLILSLFALVGCRLYSMLTSRLSAITPRSDTPSGQDGKRQLNRCWLLATATGTCGLVPLLVLIWTADGSLGDSTGWQAPAQSPAHQSPPEPSTSDEQAGARPQPQRAEQDVVDDHRGSLLTGLRDDVTQTSSNLRSPSTRASAVDDLASASLQRPPPAVDRGDPSQLDLEIIRGEFSDPRRSVDGPIATDSAPVWLQQPAATDSTWTVWLPRDFDPQSGTEEVAGGPQPPVIWRVENGATAQRLQIELRSVVGSRTPIGNRVPVEILATNHGAATVRNLSVQHTLPHNVRMVSATQELHRDAGTWHWQLDNLLPGETRRLVLLVQPIAAGSARFVSRGLLRAAVRAETQVAAHRIALNMLVPEQVHPQERARLQFRFTNTGSTHPRDLILRLYLPPQLDHSLGRTLDLAIAELPSGSPQQAQLHVRAGPEIAPAVCKASLIDGDQVITSTTATIQIIRPAEVDRQ